MVRSSRTRKGAVAMILALAGSVGAATASTASPAQRSPAAGVRASRPVDKAMTVELDWVPNPDHVSLYYGLKKGYFSRAGLSVSLQAPSNAADPIKLVGLNKVDLAISYESEMFYAQQEGLPVTAVSTIVPVPLNSLIVAPKDHVTTLSQMKGKKVGVTGIPSDGAIYQMLLRTGHLSAHQVTSVTVGESLVPSLLSGRVDAIVGGYRNVEAIQIAEQMGEKPTIFPASALGVPSYAELVLVANRNRLKSDPAYAAEVRKFVGTLSTATSGAIAHPSQATSIMKQVSQYTPKFLDVSVPYTLSLIRPTAGGKIGCMNLSSWQRFGNWMRQNKLIAKTPNATPLTTNAYLPYSC